MADTPPLAKDDWDNICPKCGKEKSQESDFCPSCERMLCPVCKKYFTDGKLCKGCNSVTNLQKHARHENDSSPVKSVPPSPVRILGVLTFIIAAVGAVFLWQSMQTKRGDTAPPAELSASAITSPTKSSHAIPVEYRVCNIDDVSTSSGIKRARIVITTEQRDMATLTTKQLAATSYSAMNYFNDGPLRDYLLINVLLMESCTSKSVTLARAQIGEGQRIVQASSTMENGPSALAITITENIEQQKGGMSRTTTADDYAAVARKMKMQPAEVKQLHFALASHAAGADFYDAVANIPATSPVTKN